jgi:predicted dehydrogenase
MTETRFRTVVAGCGMMAPVWLQALKAHADVQLVGVVDLDTDRAAQAVAAHELTVPVGRDLSAMIDVTGANLVVDLTVPTAHRSIATTALAAGCDVLGEKPLATSMDEARAIIAAADAAGRTHAVMQNRRYLPSMIGLRDMVASGVIGDLGMVAVDFLLAGHFPGFREEMESPLLLDMAVHTFDQARFVTGADAVRVSCTELQLPNSWFAGAAAAVCTFWMSDGSVLSYRGSWIAEGGPTTWEGTWRVMGKNGTIQSDGAADLYATITDPAPHRRVEGVLPAMDRTGHLACIDDMLECLRTGRRPQTDCHDNAKTLAMVCGAIESSRTGRVVEIADSATYALAVEAETGAPSR